MARKILIDKRLIQFNKSLVVKSLRDFADANLKTQVNSLLINYVNLVS